jgi:hypothetical protein
MMFTVVSNVSGLVKESAYLTNMSPGVRWLALTVTEGPRLQHRHNTKICGFRHAAMGAWDWYEMNRRRLHADIRNAFVTLLHIL